MPCHRRTGTGGTFSAAFEGIQRVDAEPAAPARGGAEVFEGVLSLMVHGSRFG